MKNLLYVIFQTNIGRMITCLALAAISLFIANYIGWMVWVALGFFVIFPLPWILLSMVYAWFINPIKDYKENKLQKTLWTDFNNWVILMKADGYSEDWNSLGNKYVRNYKILGNISQYETPSAFNNECVKKDLD